MSISKSFESIKAGQNLELPKKESLFTPPFIRLRRNRSSAAVRKLVRETSLLASDLVAPFFVIEGAKKKEPITEMPGIFRFSIDLLLEEIGNLHKRGILAVALFPVIPKERKSNGGEEAWNPNSLMVRAIRQIKKEIPSICIISDVALDPYTSHGHDGVIGEKGVVLNDETISHLIKMALVYAEAGVDFVAPSDMMDGRVRAIRQALDRFRFFEVGILSYSAKYASSLYAPFRTALNSTLSFGDKKTYQMDPANQREALLEAAMDEEEGADILMIKPALHYLDVILKLRQQSSRPLAAYHVSGEYAMVMAAHERGWLNANEVFYEALLSIKRAGADLIFSYAISRILPFL